nr:hypothetical protein [Klebsiella oxytoca]URQ56224.1 Hypothetical protein [Raoultella ornithinolytica]
MRVSLVLRHKSSKVTFFEGRKDARTRLPGQKSNYSGAESVFSKVTF